MQNVRKQQQNNATMLQKIISAMYGVSRT